MVNFFPYYPKVTIDWTDKSLTQALVLIHRLTLLNYKGNSDEACMKNHFMTALPIFAIFALSILSSCVSVNVPFGPVPKAEKAYATKPAAPFSSFVTSTADEAWISDKTGNTISYLSECKESAERIEDVALDAAKVIEKSKVIKASKGLIDSRDSYDLVVLGKVDTHKVKMAISVFRSKNCTFSLTYGGLEEHFDSELKEFELFKLGFRAP